MKFTFEMLLCLLAQSFTKSKRDDTCSDLSHTMLVLSLDFANRSFLRCTEAS